MSIIALALAAAAAPAAPPPAMFRFNQPVCARDSLEHARNAGVLYRRGDRPAEQRRLDELPDADLVLTVLRRDRRGCPIIDVVRPGVSTPGTPSIVGVPLRRTPSLPQSGAPKRGPERQR